MYARGCVCWRARAHMCACVCARVQVLWGGQMAKAAKFVLDLQTASADRTRWFLSPEDARKEAEKERERQQRRKARFQ